VPGVVRELSVVERGCNHVTLSWLPPAVPNGIIRGYIVCYRPGLYLLQRIREITSLEICAPEIIAWDYTLRAYTPGDYIPPEITDPRLQFLEDYTPGDYTSGDYSPEDYTPGAYSSPEITPPEDYISRILQPPRDYTPRRLHPNYSPRDYTRKDYTPQILHPGDYSPVKKMALTHTPDRNWPTRRGVFENWHQPVFQTLSSNETGIMSGGCLWEVISLFTFVIVHWQWAHRQWVARVWALGLHPVHEP